MSDSEGRFGGSSGVDDDLSLPKATVAKLISELLPKDMSCAKDTRDLIIECCVEFIHLLSSQANDVCEKESKKTIAPEHIITALQELDFHAFIPEVEEVLQEHKLAQKDREKKVSKLESSGKSMEELEAEQAALFAQSRARYEGGPSA